MQLTHSRIFVLLAVLVSSACASPQNGATAVATSTPNLAVPDAAPQDDPMAALVERGRYLANLMGCRSCHTSSGGHPYGGGLFLTREPYGTAVSHNLTSDAQFGLGQWSDKQIVQAVREGLRPDGSGIPLIMPYESFNALSDEDAAALVAFLRQLEPVRDAFEPPAKPFTMPHVKTPPAAGDTPKNDPLERGAYLAALMHCSHCHTPMRQKPSPYTGEFRDPNLFFAGGFGVAWSPMGSGTIYSANLTPAKTGLAGWSEEDLRRAIFEMTKPDGTPIRGPMRIFQTGWQGMPESDVSDLLLFLRSLGPIENAPPASDFKEHTSH